jgi:hypothetical protein
MSDDDGLVDPLDDDVESETEGEFLEGTGAAEVEDNLDVEVVDEFDEDDFDEDFDDDFEEEIKGEYDLEDDQYG